MAALTTITATLLVTPSAGAAAAGDLDPTFGVGGVVTTDIGFIDALRAVLVQPDGKIVAAGTATPTAWAVARYLPNGTLDQGFGAGGKVVTPALGGLAASLALGPAGTIVVAGFGDVMRYLPTGALDGSFGTGGHTVISGTRLLATTVLPDGSTLLAGGTSQGDFIVARLTPSGALDSTFGSGGRVITDLGGSEFASQLLLQPDGKLVAVGETASTGSNFALVRYLADGSLDPTFGAGGTVISDIGGPSVFDHGDDAVLTSEGKIVVTGASFPNLVLARYLPDGTLDPSFGTGGISTPMTGEAWAVAQQSDGKLVVTTGRLAAARFSAEGALDSSFGTGGIADAGLTGAGAAVALDGTGQVIVAGSGEGNFKLVRYLGFAASDTTPPQLISPAAVVVPATSPTGAIVQFNLTATDDVDGPVPVTCTPAAGTVFPIGDTTVTCSATDAAGNTTTVSFPVHVKDASEQIGDLAADLVAALGGGSLPKSVRDGLEQAAQKHPNVACNLLPVVANWIRLAIRQGKISADQGSTLTDDITRITRVLGC